MARLLAVNTLLFLFLFTAFTQPKTIRVPQDQATIQGAIDAVVDGDTVLVDEGTYFVNLVLTKKITLASRYLVDGDTSHISKTILDGSAPTKPDSGSVIHVGAGTDSTTRIMGFTITRGMGRRSEFPPYGFFRDGLGIIVTSGAVRIAHNVIANNSLTTSDQLNGGGVAIYPNPGPIGYWIIEHNTFMHNHLTTSSSSGEAVGGGVWLSQDGRLSHNLFYSNSVTALGSGHAGGGAIMLSSNPGFGTSSITVDNNEIRGNSSNKWGGGLAAVVGPAGALHIYSTLTNNIISGNSATSFASAIHFQSGTHTLVNNTIADNLGPNAIEVESVRSTLYVRMLNNVIWNTNATTEYLQTTGTNTRYRYSDYNLVRGGLSGTGNLTVDPWFIPGDTLYRTSETPNHVSPVYGRGVMSAVLGGITVNAPTTDFLGAIRPRTPGSMPDLGAIESNLTTLVDDNTNSIPDEYALDQNYPNPFNPSTEIRYQTSEVRHVRLSVFDLLGREVSVLVDEERPPGVYATTWKASQMPGGLYFCRLTAGEFTQVRKMVLMK